MKLIQLQLKNLSMREFEALEPLAHRRKNLEIASMLKIEERTVRFQLENILGKLN